MDTYLPVGTIISINNVDAMIIGYDSYNKEEELIDGYIIVKYPIGFTNENSLAFIDVNCVFDILYMGYHYNESDEYLKAQKEVFEVLKPLGADRAFKHFAEIADSIRKEVDNNVI